MEKQYTLAREQQRIYNEKEAKSQKTQRLKFEQRRLEEIIAQKVWEAKAYKNFPN